MLFVHVLWYELRQHSQVQVVMYCTGNGEGVYTLTQSRKGHLQVDEYITRRMPNSYFNISLAWKPFSLIVSENASNYSIFNVGVSILNSVFKSIHLQKHLQSYRVNASSIRELKCVNKCIVVNMALMRMIVNGMMKCMVHTTVAV